jgi:hypothetical protein
MVGWATRVLSIVEIGRVRRLRSSVILSLTLTEETSTRVTRIERGAVCIAIRRAISDWRHVGHGRRRLLAGSAKWARTRRRSVEASS